MSYHQGPEADLGLFNLEFAESDFENFRGPFLDETPVWDIFGNRWMTKAYGNQDLNQAVPLSGYLPPNDSSVEDFSPLAGCLYEPALVPNLVDIPGPVGGDLNAEFARFTLAGELHSNMNPAHPDLLDEITTATPIASGSHIQEPTKRGRGRPKGSKTKQRHPPKPKTPEEKAQAKLDKAAIRLANKKASHEAKEAERKANAAASRKNERSLASADLNGTIGDFRVHRRIHIFG